MNAQITYSFQLSLSYGDENKMAERISTCIKKYEACELKTERILNRINEYKKVLNQCAKNAPY